LFDTLIVRSFMTPSIAAWLVVLVAGVGAPAADAPEVRRRRAAAFAVLALLAGPPALLTASAFVDAPPKHGLQSIQRAMLNIWII
jgi:hypothetical protein